VRYKVTVYLSATIGLAVPLLSAVTLHFLTIVGLGPLSIGARFSRFLTALIWPTFVPFSMLLGSGGYSQPIIIALIIATLANVAIYVLLGSVFWVAMSEKKLRILSLIPIFLIAIYWYWVVSVLAIWPLGSNGF